MIIVTPLGKFRSQQSEWEKSVVVTGMGAVFLAPGDAMATPGLKWMQTVMPETAWGAVFLLFGSIALLALWINGKRDRITTWTRAASAIMRFALFFALTIAAILKGEWGVGQVLWPAFMAVEAANIYFTMIDTGSASAHHSKSSGRPNATSSA